MENIYYDYTNDYILFGVFELFSTNYVFSDHWLRRPKGYVLYKLWRASSERSTEQ